MHLFFPVERKRPHGGLRRVTLPAGSTWSGKAPRRCNLFCERGVLWLTQSNDLGDYALRQGESFVASAGSKIVVEAMEDATFHLMARKCRKTAV
jgi:hypothetical protein